MAGKKGVLDLIVGKLHMNDDDDDPYYDDDDDPYYDEGGSNIEPFRRTERVKEDASAPEPEKAPERLAVKKSASRSLPAVKNVRRSGGGMSASGMEVCVIKPTSVEEAREITETLLNNRTVVLNLEGLDVDIAQRIIDFTSGSTYAVSGNLQKISRYIFIVTPASVDISGDFQELLTGTISQGGPQGIE